MALFNGAEGKKVRREVLKEAAIYTKNHPFSVSEGKKFIYYKT